MTKLQAVGLQNRTLEIKDNFFPKIKRLDINDGTNYQMDLARCVKTFFEEMNQVGEQEFASFLKKHQFENTDAGQQQKYTDAFNCLVAFIVAEYSESDLLRYFLAKNSSPEAKPTSDSHSWRIVYWAQLLGYWARKLFNTQRFVVNAEIENESLGSAIDAIRIALKEKKANYFDLHQNSAFNENLEIVVGKFVKNRHLVLNNSLEDSVSEIGVPLPFFQPQNTTENLDITLSTSSVAPPPPAFPPPPPSEVTEELTSFKPTVSNVGNDRDNLLIAIKQGIKLKSVNEGEKLPNNSHIKSNDLMGALKEVLSKRRNDIEVDLEKTLEDNGEDWVDGPGISANSFYFNALNEAKAANLIAKLRESLPQNFNEIKLTNTMCIIKSSLEAIGVELFSEQPAAIASEVLPQKTNWQLFKKIVTSYKDSGQSQQSNENVPKPAANC